MGEWESGRVGEWESGRVGEGARGRKGGARKPSDTVTQGHGGAGEQK